MKTILITGGTGFIGSHSCIALGKTGRGLVILGNRCKVINRLAVLCGRRLDLVHDVVGESEKLDQDLSRSPLRMADFLNLWRQIASVSNDFAGLDVLSLLMPDCRNGGLYFSFLRINEKYLDPIPRILTRFRIHLCVEYK